MNTSIVKLPAFNVQYYEFEKKIDFPVDLYHTPTKIDGLFEYPSTSRFCLGYLVNLRRKPESLECLVNLKSGIEFYKDEEDSYFAKSNCQIPVYILIKGMGSQILLEPGSTKFLYSLKPLIHHKILPKKVGKIYDVYTIRVSFGKEFQKRDNQEIDYISPCWIEMRLNRMIDSP